MIISDNLKFIFIHVHRTGGASLSSLLKNELKEKVKVISQHDNAKTVDSHFFTKYQDYFTFGFVRNPWQRILSWYFLLNKNENLDDTALKKDFEYFLYSNLESSEDTIFDNYLMINQLDYFIDKDGTLHNDYFGRFENYENDVKFITEKIGINQAIIPHVNQSISKEYRLFYSLNAKKIIQLHCQKDINFFSYSF